MSSYIRFLDTGVLSPAMNMAIDDALLTCHVSDHSVPTVRVFRWSEKTLTLGRFQRITEEVNMNACQTWSVIPVRRPTGGKAVYHQDDVTYSFTGDTSLGIPEGIVPAYAFLSSAIRIALLHLHIPFAPSENVSVEPKNAQPSPVCFATDTPADVLASGVKLVGSAQVWRETRLLQQGSIPLYDHASELFALLRFTSEDDRNRACAIYKAHAPGLTRYVPSLQWQDVVDALREGFAELFHCPIVYGQLTDEELHLAERLEKIRYATL